ncbi:MAG: hypothetical protein COC24_019200 [Alphaproteobacteria bacterium]|nr:hypothetical protein [Alphaproteobacteria bacterium]
MNLMTMNRKRRHDLDFFNHGVRIYDFERDRIASKTDFGHIADQLTYTRGSDMLMANAQGEYHNFVADDVAQTNLGMKVGPQVTNHIISAGMQGASVGVLGAAGSLPTGWTYNAAGGQFEILAVGVERGLPYFEVKYSIANGGSVAQPYIQSANAVVVDNGEDWAFSNHYKKVAGQWPAHASVAQLDIYGADGTDNPAANRLDDMTEFSRVVQIENIARSNPVTCDVNPLYLVVAANEIVDLTLRIYTPQFEFGTFANDPIVTAENATGSCAEIYAESDISALGLDAGGILVEFNLHNFDTGDRLLSFSGGTKGLNVYCNSTNSVQMKCSYGGNVYSSTTALNVGDNKLMVTWSGDEFKLFLNGTLRITKNASRVLTAADFEEVTFGAAFGGSLFTNATFKKAVIFNETLTDAECMEWTIL